MNLNKPTISVIIPCYNQAQYIECALQSVLSQSYDDWECIIVNDGSPDHTGEIAKHWIAKDPRFKYLEKNNGGLSSARNAGIEIALGEYILPLDADDYISDNYLLDCIKVIEKNKDIKIVYGKAIKFGVEQTEWKLPDYSFLNLLEYNMIYCSAIYRKSDWKNIGGYDTELKSGFEDWEFWISLLKEGGRVERVLTCTFFYRVKEESMIKSLASNTEEKKRISEYIFNKHRTCYTNKSYYDLYLLNKNLTLKLLQLEVHISFVGIIFLLIKKIRYILIRAKKRLINV